MLGLPELFEEGEGRPSPGGAWFHYQGASNEKYLECCACTGGSARWCLFNGFQHWHKMTSIHHIARLLPNGGLLKPIPANVGQRQGIHHGRFALRTRHNLGSSDDQLWMPDCGRSTWREHANSTHRLIHCSYCVGTEQLLAFLIQLW